MPLSFHRDVDKGLNKFLDVVRLLQEPDRCSRPQLAYHVALAVTAAQYDAGLGVNPAHGPKNLIPAHLGHCQVEQHGTDLAMPLPEQLDCLLAIMRLQDLEAIPAEGAP